MDYYIVLVFISLRHFSFRFSFSYEKLYFCVFVYIGGSLYFLVLIFFRPYEVQLIPEACIRFKLHILSRMCKRGKMLLSKLSLSCHCQRQCSTEKVDHRQLVLHDRVE